MNNFFNMKNIKMLEEEKPRIYDKTQESQLKNFSLHHLKNKKNQIKNNKYNDYEFPNELSTLNKKFIPISSQLNIMNNINNHYTDNNSLNENNEINNIYNINSNLEKKRMNTYSSAIFNISNLKINKNNESNKDKNIMELIFNKLGIGNLYLEKMFFNKIDFSDLLLLTKDDLKEMDIPIGPRNRILSFIKNYTLYKESLKGDNYDSINQFFNLNSLTINSPNSTISNNDNLYHINSPTINIKTKYNNNFSSNPENNILIKQETKNYLNNNNNYNNTNTNSLNFNINKNLFVKKKNSYNKKSSHPFIIENNYSAHENNEKRDTTIEHNFNGNFDNYFKRKQNKGSNISENYRKAFLGFYSKKEKKSNSKIKYENENINNSRNNKNLYDDNIKKNNSYSQNKKNNQKEKYKKAKKIHKSLNSFTEEGLNILNKMKKNLNSKLKNYTKSIGEKKLLLKLLEGKNNEIKEN